MSALRRGCYASISSFSHGRHRQFNNANIIIKTPGFTNIITQLHADHNPHSPVMFAACRLNTTVTTTATESEISTAPSSPLSDTSIKQSTTLSTDSSVTSVTPPSLNKSPSPQTTKPKQQQPQQQLQPKNPSSSVSTHHLVPLAKAWLEILHYHHKSAIKPSAQEFTNLALSLHQDPARFVKEFAPVVEYCLNLGFTPEEDEIILAFAKTSLNKGARDTSKIRFGDLTQALKRSWREIRDRYVMLVQVPRKQKQPQQQPKPTDTPKRSEKNGVPIVFKTTEEEQEFINNMLRSMHFDGYVPTPYFQRHFYPHLNRLDVAATCKGIKRKYSVEQLLEMRAKLCEEEDLKMRKLVGEWKLEDGTPDYDRFEKEFKGTDRYIVKRKVHWLYEGRDKLGDEVSAKKDVRLE
ncbi:hypothetical protein HDU76_007234 [Blyttiomyces sp. JEL0837]|nr:hypothetical protein HDU76_007234 [Blyttiomyces sp. JEL0837]